MLSSLNISPLHCPSPPCRYAAQTTIRKFHLMPMLMKDIVKVADQRRRYLALYKKQLLSKDTLSPEVRAVNRQKNLGSDETEWREEKNHLSPFQPLPSPVPSTTQLYSSTHLPRLLLVESLPLVELFNGACPAMMFLPFRVKDDERTT